jgi:hypothetical protein
MAAASPTNRRGPCDSLSQAAISGRAMCAILAALGCCLAATPARAQRRPVRPPLGPITTAPAPPPIVSAPQTGQLPGYTNRSLTTSSGFLPPPATTGQSGSTAQPLTSASQATPPAATPPAVAAPVVPAKLAAPSPPLSTQPAAPAATSSLPVAATTPQLLTPPKGLPAVPPRRPTR